MALVQLAVDSVSLILNGRPYADFIEGDFIDITFPNDLTSHVNSANGGANINKRVDAAVCDVVIRVQKYSGDDTVLNSAINQEAPVIFNGSIKEDFIRDGVAGAESYILENGSLTTRPKNTKNNKDGNGAMEYTIHFRNVSRNI